MKIQTIYGSEETATHYCKKCDTHKPVSEFVHRDRASNGLKPINSCKECDEKPKKQLALLKKYTPKPDSDHVCPLCLRGADVLGYTSPFVLEHNHITGEFRGWVCHDCNTAMSRVRDDPDTLRRMAEYLEKE